MRRRTAGIGAINKDKRKAELLKDKGSMRPLFSINHYHHHFLLGTFISELRSFSHLRR